MMKQLIHPTSYRPHTKYNGRLCFQRCVSVQGKGGVPQPPVPGPFRGKRWYPSQVPEQGYPVPIPQPRSEQEHPSPNQVQRLGYPLPPVRSRKGVPPFPGRTRHGQVMVRVVRLLRFHAAELSCYRMCPLNQRKNDWTQLTIAVFLSLYFEDKQIIN